MKLYTKYQIPGPSGFRQDFLNFQLKNLFLAPVLAVQWTGNGLSNFGRGSPKEHFSEMILKSVQQFWRNCLKQKLTKEEHTHGRRTEAYHNSSS